MAKYLLAAPTHVKASDEIHSRLHAAFSVIECDDAAGTTMIAMDAAARDAKANVEKKYHWQTRQTRERDDRRARAGLPKAQARMLAESEAALRSSRAPSE